MLYINDRLQDLDLDEAIAQLSEQRRAQALRFTHDMGQRTCAAAYLLLCEGLQKEYGIVEKPVFSYGPHGKPFIVGHEDIHFSLSHCREAAICIISEKPVGIDIESLRHYSESLLRYTMNAEEQALILQAENPALAFTRLWTMKEAVVKRTGHGIDDNIKDVLTRENMSELTTVVSPDMRYVYSYV